MIYKNESTAVCHSDPSPVILVSTYRPTSSRAKGRPLAGRVVGHVYVRSMFIFRVKMMPIQQIIEPDVARTELQLYLSVDAHRTRLDFTLLFCAMNSLPCVCLLVKISGTLSSVLRGRRSRSMVLICRSRHPGIFSAFPPTIS